MVNLKTKTARWYEVTAVVDRTQDDGSLKKVKEIYVTEALSCIESETRVVDEVVSPGVLEVVKVQLLPASEFVFEQSEPSELWYKVKVLFITLDERSEKEKRTAQYLYVQAKDLAAARNHIVDVFADTMCGYTIAAISETTVLEVFEHNVEGGV